MATVGSIVIGAIVNTSSAISSIERLSKSLDKIARTGIKEVSAGAEKVGEGLGKMSTGATSAFRGLATRNFGAIKEGFGGIAEGASKATGGIKQMGLGFGRLSLGVVASGLRGIGGILKQMPVFLTSVAVKALAAATAMTALAVASGSSVDKAGDMADQLGTTTSELLKLRYAATLTGSSAESMDAALAKMNANLGDAATKGGPAADALTKIGLDAKQLIQVDPTVAFKAIANGLRLIPTPAERAAAALDIFGKGGVAVLTTIQAGPTEIQRLGAEFESFGGAVSESSRQSVGAMFDAFDRIGAIISAFGAKVAVAAAPYVVALGDAFVTLAKSGQGVAVISPALDAVATAVEIVGRTVDNVQLAWFGLRSNGLGAIAAIAKGFAMLGEVVSSVVNLIPGMDVAFGSTSRAMADQLDQLANEAHATGQKLLASAGFGESFKTAFDRVRNGAASIAPAIDPATAAMKRMATATDEAGNKVGDLVAKLKEERDTFGMSSTMVDIYRLRKSGATEQSLKSAVALANELEGMKRFQDGMSKQFEAAKSIFESTRTPLEKFREEVGKINSLKAAGMLDADTAARGVAKAKSDFMGADKQFQAAQSLLESTQTPLEKFQKELTNIENLKAAGLVDANTAARGAEKAKADFMGNAPQRGAALELGSQEARKAILDFRGQGSKDRPLQDVAASTKESAKQSQIQSALLTKLLDSFGKLTVNPDPVF